MRTTLLLWPLIPYALVTLLLYIPMSRARVRTVKEGGVKGSVYKLNIDEPEESLRFSNAIRNQNEIGLLFYSVCLVLAVSGGASYLTAALAWAFVIVKCVHVWIHVTSNSLRRRRPVFTVAYFIVVALWLLAALHLAGII